MLHATLKLCRVASCSEVFNVVVALLLLPEGQVLLEELNDALGITEGFLINIIDLVHCILKSSLSELAG